MKKGLRSLRRKYGKVLVKAFLTVFSLKKTRINPWSFPCFLICLSFSFQQVSAQTCSATDYNVVSNKQMITLTTSASVSGNINVLKDGNVSNNSYYYTGTNQAVANKEYVRMQFPSPTVLQGFEIAVGAYLFKNGTLMRVDGSNDGVNWVALHTETETASVSSCIYGTCGSAESYSFSSNTTAYTYYRLFGVSGNSRSTPWINELFFDIVPIEQSGITNVDCNANGTLFDAADDYITFELNPTGGTGTYNVSVAGTSVTPSSGTFGVATSFSLGAGTAGNGDLSMTITGFTAGCQIVETITDPGNCLPGECGGTDWNLPAEKINITGTFDLPENSGHTGNITNLVDSDQGSVISTFTNNFTQRAVFVFQFPQATVLHGIELNTKSSESEPITAGVFRIEGSDDGSTYVPVSGDFTYGSNLNAGVPQYGGTGTLAYTFPFPSNTTAYTYYRVYAVSMSTRFSRDFTEVYFDYDVFDASLTNIGCDDNGSPTNFTDDKVTFELNPSPGTGTYEVTVSGGFTISPTTANFGQTTSFTVSSGSAGAGDLTVQVIDASVPCVQEVIIPNTMNTCLDTDLDGVQDISDLDDDNDGILDTDENALCEAVDYNILANKQTIQISTTASVSGNINILLNGNLTETVFYYQRTSIVGRELARLQFQKPTILTGIEYYIGNSYMLEGGAQTVIEASNDGINWVAVSPTYTKAGNTNSPGVISAASHAETFLWANTTPYLYYRHYGLAGRSNLNPWVYEMFFRTEAFAICDQDEDGIANQFDLDSDNDGIPDNVEGQPTLTYQSPAPDNNTTYAGNDGVNSAYLGGVSVPDTDGDLCPDFLDTDSEGDGILDKDESGLSLSGTVGSNGLDNALEGADTYADVNGNIDDPDTDLAGDGPGVEVDYRKQNINVTVTANQAACASPTDNPLSSITVTGLDGAITKAGYSTGTVYFGPDFNSATPVSNLPAGFTVVSGLPNPDFTTYYTVRAYLDAVSFEDYVVSIDRKICSTADLSLQISPATDSANEGENLVYTVTLTNNGPDPAINVAVKVDIPSGLDLITVNPSLGEFSPGSQLWTIDQVPVGDQMLTITYRMR